MHHPRPLPDSADHRGQTQPATLHPNTVTPPAAPRVVSLRADQRRIHDSIADVLARDPERYEGTWSDVWPELLEAALRATWRDGLVVCVCCQIPLLVTFRRGNDYENHWRGVPLLEARNIAGYLLSQRQFFTPIPEPPAHSEAGRAADAVHALTVALAELDSQPLATRCNGTEPTEPDPSDTGRPADRRVRVAVIATDEDKRGVWAITTCPVEVLGWYDGEATEIPRGFMGDVVLLDPAPGFPAGCATWSQFSDSTPDREQPNLSERHRARTEHWNCEHALFGADPLDGWICDPGPGGKLIERWTFDALAWKATITRSHAEPDVAHLSLAHRDRRPTIVDMIAHHDMNEAKRIAIDFLRSHILAEADTDQPDR